MNFVDFLFQKSREGGHCPAASSGHHQQPPDGCHSIQHWGGGLCNVELRDHLLGLFPRFFCSSLLLFSKRRGKLESVHSERYYSCTSYYSCTDNDVYLTLNLAYLWQVRLVISKYIENKRTQRSIYRQASSFSHDFHGSTVPNRLRKGSLPALFHHHVRRNRSSSEAVVSVHGFSGMMVPMFMFALINHEENLTIVWLFHTFLVGPYRDKQVNNVCKIWTYKDNGLAYLTRTLPSKTLKIKSEDSSYLTVVHSWQVNFWKIKQNMN